MPYREARPSPMLASWVDCYWTRSGPAPEIDRVLPDGCADVIFDLRRGDALAVGTMTAPLLVETAEPELFGIRFRPGRASLAMGVPLSEITDRTVPARDVRTFGADLAGRLAIAPSFEERIAIVEAALAHALTVAGEDRAVDAAVEWIVRSHGTRPVEAIVDSIGISRQHLARRFSASVGVSPKMLSRVMRFRHALRAARGDDVDWAEVALRAGYFDQSHLIADFRQFAGTTPVHFVRSRILRSIE